MANPRAFISFDFDHDLTPKNLFAGQAKTDSPSPFTAEDWSSKSSLPQAQWEALIRDKINRCHFMVVLVGLHMSTATGVVKEIQMARDLYVPYFGVYVNGASSSSTLPTGLSRGACVTWKWEAIAGLVDQCMNAGKNK